MLGKTNGYPLIDCLVLAYALADGWCCAGTHVTGTIGAIGNNGKGVIGVIPGAQCNAHGAFRWHPSELVSP